MNDRARWPGFFFAGRADWRFSSGSGRVIVPNRRTAEPPNRRIAQARKHPTAEVQRWPSGAARLLGIDEVILSGVHFATNATVCIASLRRHRGSDTCAATFTECVTRIPPFQGVSRQYTTCTHLLSAIWHSASHALTALLFWKKRAVTCLDSLMVS